MAKPKRPAIDERLMIRADVFDLGRGSGDAGVVDEDIEAAKLALDVME